MKLAIIGSRGLFPSAEQIGSALFCEVTEIVSGGARGVDSCARAAQTVVATTSAATNVRV